MMFYHEATWKTKVRVAKERRYSMPSNYNLMAFWEMGVEIGCNWRLRRREGAENVGEF